MLVREGNKISVVRRKRAYEFLSLGKKPEVKEAFKKYVSATKACTKFLKQLPKCYQTQSKTSVSISGDNEKMLGKVANIANLAVVTALSPITAIAGSINSLMNKIKPGSTDGRVQLSDTVDDIKNATKDLTKISIYNGHFVDDPSNVWVCITFGYTEKALDEIEDLREQHGDADEDTEVADYDKAETNVIPNAISISAWWASKYYRKIYRIEECEKGLSEVASWLNKYSDPVSRIQA